MKIEFVEPGYKDRDELIDGRLPRGLRVVQDDGVVHEFLIHARRLVLKDGTTVFALLTDSLNLQD
jgi:hypothetical protein